MFKKILSLILIVTFVSCNASKPVIITKKGTSQKPKKQLVWADKKSNISTKSSKQKQGNPAMEIIESTSKTVVTNDLVNAYIFQYKDIAMANMKNYGIPASIILAQGILESGAGNGDLALSANNHFGIKCFKDWTGDTVNHDDDASQECFRKYATPEESYRDHAAILTQRTRYASLFCLLKGDYKSWAKGLRAAGYATDPKYPDKLISYIERFHLNQYDNQVLGKEYAIDEKQTKKPTNAAIAIQDRNLYEVQKGDTLYSISKKFNLMVNELKQKNSITDYSLSIGQKLKVN